MYLLKRLTLTLIMLLSCAAFSQNTQQSHVAESRNYQTLNQIFQIMKDNVVTRDKVDWTRLKQELERLDDPLNNKKFFEAVYTILQRTDTGHSFYRSSIEPKFIMHRKFTCSQHLPDLQTVPEDIGYILIDGFSKNDQGAQLDYIKHIREQINQHDQEHIKGWIVDLRYNTGGNMWPMLAGIAPLLKNGTHGYFVNQFGLNMPWGTQNGFATLNSNKAIGLPNDQSINGDKPVAILSSQRTASSGEAILIAFKDRKNSKFFGHPSCGMSSANRPFNLLNGATLLVTTSIMASASHQIFGEPIAVDVETEASITEAVKWIRKQDTIL